ncbi:aminoglycoside phosphotransferase family protein [Vibrio parahaemolyticus]|uniref:Aminoglycoside phosphotransferase family protein n=1 Tax=Vibrio parahaemolyticus TaxID=670 RepID=A0A7Y0X6L1_VIBPH|nr:aminoglycoside phosphotransferase family protein [Vibrio parahaemolyticus]EHC7291194.1 aminoglycoside phosphotransferase family protein [Vibrio parahaemolyticus]EJE4150222.1 aminoglycoside phosphotransferase family protein [Vibrio parahaemolyticus]ELU0552477.1 aminoglycoside phosphotransferase family protein [Vibrio parahaemolyticus]MCZ5860825.1 aminoglycoside phosphotransferase family protein [Vibrio parahaemolyticus]MCZ6279614.1 aminoglycoside phosphotransferase family protein [Vibrio par
MEELSGGRESAIYRDGEVVYRPLQSWSSTIHLILKHLERAKFAETPKFLGVNKDQEILSFVAGNTYNYPLVGAIATNEALVSAGKLLRKVHDSTVSLLEQLDVNAHRWMLEPREPFEVICHGDFTPYNVALLENKVVGVFDFDTAHPAPRVWDLAYSVYCWSPFKTDSNDKLGTISEQLARARLFCDSYGATESEREQLADIMVQRLQALVSFKCSEAENGNESFAENIEQGHLQAYLNDIEYITENKQKIQCALCN